MILLSLFLAFFHIGAIAFGGGYAVLPVLEEVIVTNHGWLTSKEIIDIITISQMTPGPIAINAATFVGTKVAGLAGSIVSTLGNVLPQFILMLLLARLVFSDKKITFMDNIIRGLKPGMVALIFIASLSMVNNSIFNSGDILNGIKTYISSISLVALMTFILAFILRRKKVGIIKIIAISAGLGIFLSLLAENIGLSAFL